MRKVIVVFLLLFCCGGLFAQQNGKMKKVYLQNGTVLNAYVEKLLDGNYKLTTKDENVFYFRQDEISFTKMSRVFQSQTQATDSTQTNLESYPQTQNSEQFQVVRVPKYKELKTRYSTKDYNGYQPGDRYNPGLIGTVSFLVPGLGHYLTGCRVGLGITQTCLFAISFPCIFLKKVDYAYTSYSSYGGTTYNYYSYFTTTWFKEVAIPMLCVWLGTATWSACSAVKAAKIKNMYYRDVRNGVVYNFDVSPYVDLSCPTLASNSNVVSGLSFKIRF